MTSTKMNTGQNLVVIAILLAFNFSNALGNQFNRDDTVRSIFMGHGSPLAKGGWRPIMNSDSLGSFSMANPMFGGQSLGQKILTGPALIETKVISPHIVNVSPFADYNIISTSTRPLVTRDTNKLTTIAHTYKSMPYPSTGPFNLNAPVNTYVNPFVLPTGPGIVQYKGLSGHQQMDGFHRPHHIHQQQQQSQIGPMMHRPVTYAKPPGQMVLGKRLKPNQMTLQQLSNNYHHQMLQSYVTNVKKPVEVQKWPVRENFGKPTGGGNNFQSNVNPKDSLNAQVKPKGKPAQNMPAVTYKPPFNQHSQHLQQLGIKEEPFSSIPSSILGSFSSFGHASVKARDPIYNQNKVNLLIPTTTPAPVVSTDTLAASTTVVSKVNYSTHIDHKKVTPTKKPSYNGIFDQDYTKSLTPPPQTGSYSTVFNRSKTEHTNAMGSFIPSPPDPLSKHQNAPEILKSHANKMKQSYNYNGNSGPKRPEMTSFFDSNSVISTAKPLDGHITKTVPESPVAQVPPPNTKTSSYVQTIKYENGGIKENYHIHHTKVPVKYSEETKYFTPTRGQELFGSKYVKPNTVSYETTTKPAPTISGYEVTENWGSSGEFNTQPTLHTWINSGYPYKHYSTDLKPPPPPHYKIVTTQGDRLIPVSFPPLFKTPAEIKLPPPPELSTVFTPPEEDSKHKTFFAQLENSLSSLDDLRDTNPIGDEEYDLATPANVSSVSEEKPVSVSTTASYDDYTTVPPKQRKPSRNRLNFETTTVTIDNEDFTTRYETYKEPTLETENDLQANELPTIPPSKHFKRPVTTTPTYDTWDDNKQRKRNKNRRRRPLRPTTTPEDVIQDVPATTSQPTRSYKSTTTASVQETSTRSHFNHRQRLRLPYNRLRHTTKPTNQPELTSSAQPTLVPTSPVTHRSKFNSRVKPTETLSPLDFEDLIEPTTERGFKSQEAPSKQSSIMKIAKDSSKHPTTPTRDTFYETPDYSHKQDEKDTPTSDISLSPSDQKYLVQKSKNEANRSESNLNDFLDFNYEFGPFDGPANQLEGDSSRKNASESEDDKDEASTTPSSKLQRFKVRPNKYESNRPRFSVKDYRNRLGQQSSTTEKTTVSTMTPSISTRLRFPNRSRPPFKDHSHHFDKSAGSEAANATDALKKKFTPKDPRHGTASDGENNSNNGLDKSEDAQEQDNEVKKAISKLRGGPRRTSTESSVVTEKSSVTTHVTIKRPSLRKKPLNAETTVETPDSSVSPSSVAVTTTEPQVEVDTSKVDGGSTEKYTSETAIMKIAKDAKHTGEEETVNTTSVDHSQRVSDLTLASSKDYATSGLFKTISPNTRRVPNYFTIATDDPILPIEAFFPQLNQKKDA